MGMRNRLFFILASFIIEILYFLLTAILYFNDKNKEKATIFRMEREFFQYSVAEIIKKSNLRHRLQNLQ
jgi:hypothetical protein